MPDSNFRRTGIPSLRHCLQPQSGAVIQPGGFSPRTANSKSQIAPLAPDHSAIILTGENAMTITIDATYENGVLKPAQPLPLSEHAQVRVTVEPTQKPMRERAVELTADATPDELAKLPDNGASQMETAKPLAEQPPNNEVPLWEQILALTRDLPPEAFDGMPADGASQHDHYIYGSPKRTDLRDKPE